MYKFKGSITEDDYIDFNVFHVNNSKSLRKRDLSLKVIFPIGFTLFVILSGNKFDEAYWAMLLLGSLLFIFLMPILVEKSVRQRTRAMLRDDHNGDLFNEADYLFDESGIKIESANSSSFIKWRSVSKILENEERFFIYVNSVQALIIPKAYLNNNDQIDEFREYIKSLIEKYK